MENILNEIRAMFARNYALEVENVALRTRLVHQSEELARLRGELCGMKSAAELTGSMYVELHRGTHETT